MVCGRRNEALQEVFAEAGYTDCPQFSRDLAAYFLEKGARIRGVSVLEIPARTIANWLNGQQPRELVVRRLVAELFSYRVGRLITPADLGWEDPVRSIAELGLAHDPAARGGTGLAALGELLRSETIPSRRAFLDAATVSVNAFTVAAWRWLVGVEPPSAGGDGPPLAGGDGPAQGGDGDIRAITAQLRAMGNAQGSGGTRAAATGHLGNVLDMCVRGLRPAPLGAAAELTELVMSLSYDSGLAALAQRYGIQALWLCRAAGDRALGAYVLAGLSLQALDAGDPGAAAELCRAGRLGLGRLGLGRPGAPTVTAVLLAGEARAHAARAAAGAPGAAQEALACLAHADELAGELAGAGGRKNHPDWIGDYAGTEYPAQKASCLLELGRADEAEAPARAAWNAASDDGAVDRVRYGCLLATVHLRRRDGLEQALGVAEQAIKYAAGVRSARALACVAEVARRLALWEREPRVQEFGDRLARLREANR